MELGSTNSSCVLSCSMTEGLMVIKAQRIGDGLAELHTSAEVYEHDGHTRGFSPVW